MSTQLAPLDTFSAANDRTWGFLHFRSRQQAALLGHRAKRVLLQFAMVVLGCTLLVVRYVVLKTGWD